jgi:hypothetical protein
VTGVDVTVNGVVAMCKEVTVGTAAPINNVQIIIPMILIFMVEIPLSILFVQKIMLSPFLYFVIGINPLRG